MHQIKEGTDVIIFPVENDSKVIFHENMSYFTCSLSTEPSLSPIFWSLVLASLEHSSMFPLLNLSCRLFRVSPSSTPEPESTIVHSPPMSSVCKNQHPRHQLQCITDRLQKWIQSCLKQSLVLKMILQLVILIFLDMYPLNIFPHSIRVYCSCWFNENPIIYWTSVEK